MKEGGVGMIAGTLQSWYFVFYFVSDLKQEGKIKAMHTVLGKFLSVLDCSA